MHGAATAAVCPITKGEKPSLAYWIGSSTVAK